MKKQETRWISRDDDGTYIVWKKKPKMVDGNYDGYGIIQRNADSWERCGVTLKCGKLAKVIIRRQYDG